MQYFDAEIGKATPILLESSYISDDRNVFDGIRIADNPFYICIHLCKR